MGTSVRRRKRETMWGREGRGNQLFDNIVSCFVLFSWHHARGKLFTSEDRSYRIRGSPPGRGPAV